MKTQLTLDQLEKRKKTNKTILTYGCLPIALIFVVAMVLAMLSDDNPSEIAKTETAKIAETSVPEESVIENWTYQDDENKMGTKLKLANTISKDVLQFDFPYQGGSESTLTIQKMSGTTSVIFGIKPGQILTDKSIKLKFDDRKPYTVSGSASGDYRSDIVFLGSSSKVLSDIKKSKKLVMEVSFYQEGSQIIEFDIEGLNW